MESDSIRCTVAIGTRPELIKCAPVIRELRKRGYLVRVLFTGQHTDLLTQTSLVLGVAADVNYQVAQSARSLPQLAAAVMRAVEADLVEWKPNCLLVQGDTITAAASSWVAFLLGCPVGHVEAGLRTYDPLSPFPEEFCRRAIAAAATWHFAPTSRAQQNLLGEGIAEAAASVVGNTAIDNLHWARQKTLPTKAWPQTDGLKVLVTLHRRENQQGQISQVLLAIENACARHGAQAILPQHPSPNVRREIDLVVRGFERLSVIPAADYLTFVSLMAEADVIVTDSGGVQEEAPALQTPVLVARDSTERPEAVESGCARLVGAEYASVFAGLDELLSSSELRESMMVGFSPFGDGFSSSRIADILEEHFSVERRIRIPKMNGEK